MAGRLRRFPWEALERLSRPQVEAIRSARAALAGALDPGQIADVAAVMLGQPVELHVRSVSLARALPAAPGRLWLSLPGGRACGWVEAEAPLQRRVAAALLGAAAGWSDPRARAAPEVEGAWAAFLVALARRSGPGAPFRLAPPEHPVSPQTALFRLVLLIGDDVFDASVGVPLDLIPAPSGLFSLADLASLGAVPLALPLVGATSLATRAELDDLVVGAAWAPGPGWTLARSGGGWAGRGVLAAAAAEQGLGVEIRALGPGLDLVLTRSSVPLPWEASMPDSLHPPTSSPAEPDVAEALADAPVVMRVEVATVTLEARAWARLAPGDVVATGVRLGEPVALRVGGALFARGELCDLDGELAVRILERKS